MNDPNDRPSIFTPRFTRKVSQPPPLPAIESPFLIRRQSSPAAPRSGVIPVPTAHAVEAQAKSASTRTSSPTSPEDQQTLKQPPSSLLPSIWTSCATDFGSAALPPNINQSTSALALSDHFPAEHHTQVLAAAPAVAPLSPAFKRPRSPPWTPPASQQRSVPLKRRRATNTDLVIPDLIPFESISVTDPPSRKRHKLHPRSKHTLNSSAEHSSAPLTFNFDRAVPPSPLFFSNSPRSRPALPARFSSSEAAARMLSKARTEDGHVKTVSLARGTIASSTPGSYSGPTSAPQVDRRSLERGMTARSDSPESAISGSGGSGRDGIAGMLNAIGIVELLEQDERPTFIVDLGDSSNYGESGPLNLVFGNSSLRSYDGLQALVAGTATTSEDAMFNPKAFLQFKVWLLSATINGESLNVCLPPFDHAGLTWSCSTLRKRLRVISGAFNTPSTAGIASAGAMKINVQPEYKASQGFSPEPVDYFGGTNKNDASQVAPQNSSESTTLEVVPTIEHCGHREAVASIDVPTYIAGSYGSEQLYSSTLLLPQESHTYVDSHSDRSLLNGRADHEIVDCNMAVLANEDISDRLISTVRADSPCFDWTRLPVSESMPSHIQFARSVDWGATHLGPIETWTSDLRQMCNLIMASPHPAAMYWGDDLVAIYNEAYVVLAGQKHPKLMGMSYRVAWAEIWDEVKDVFANARTTGEATMKDDDCLFIRRSDHLEETYFSWSIIPMVGQDGSVMGLYNPAFEKTRRKIAERRMLTLREVGEKTASARDVKGFWAEVLAAIEPNEYDSPFMLLYSAADETDSDSSSIHSNSIFGSRQCYLEGSLGVPEGHPCAPKQIDLKTGMDGFGPVFREVMKTNKFTLLDVGSHELPDTLLEGLELRGFDDPLKNVLVCPVHPTTGEGVLGFLVLGVNPRRPYDDDYGLFIQLLTRQLATSLASVVLFEEEIRRGQRAAQLAAIDKMQLSAQLAARTQEARDSESKFTRMAEFAPVGMFIASSDGKITFANDSWYSISRVPKTSKGSDKWQDAVMPEDRALVDSLWHDLVFGAKPAHSEFRFRAPWESTEGTKGETWVLFSCYPEKDADGRLKSIFGVMTDISQQKWAEGLQTRKMEEAVELKRQQENFIDMTSHEMRNPLSAILQCSDEIESSLARIKNSNHGTGAPLPDELISSCLDAAQTIRLCSQHQKRIVDDILTLSKLDSQLLLVTPVDAQPLTVVKRALKMHEGELQAADIQMKFIVDHSFRELELDWVRFDPSRVLQVLINLTTNAIKFTSSESKRTITVAIAASRERPSEKSDAPVKYFPTRSRNRDTMRHSDWGDGEQVYVLFAVSDTGRGLSPEEKKLLFIRFSQASPRTHVQYGGSGLGLFISRELTELQGGEIGVESEAGKGSTFAFYVSARRSKAPQHETDGATGHRRVSPMLDSRAKLGLPATPVTSKGAEATLTKPPISASATASTNTKVSAGHADEGAIRKVLIVEDNLVNQRVLQKALKNLGMQVAVANHGGECIERLMQSTYWKESPGTLELGVVLLDQEMPVMDGLTCTRKIRELEANGKLTGHVPIIAVTANARPEQVQTALDAGMDDVVSKPFRMPDLVPKIEDLMFRFPMPVAAETSHLRT